MKIPRRIIKLLVVSFATLYMAGAGYFAARVFLRHAGEFGAEEPHWLERALGPVHVAAALFFIFVLGILWDQHIRPAIRAGQSRPSGWLHLALLALLALTGIVILYGSESWIRFAEQWHPWIGLSMLPVLMFHSLRRRRRTPRPRAPTTGRRRGA